MKKEVSNEMQEIFQNVNFKNVYAKTNFNDDYMISKIVEISNFDYDDCKTFLDFKLGRISEEQVSILESNNNKSVKKIKKEKKVKTKLNKCLLISFILGVLYAIYIIVYFTSCMTSSKNEELIEAMIATRIVMPHMKCTILATVFNGLGLFLKNCWLTLVGAICYILAILMFPMYFFFVTIQGILSFVGFAQLKKEKKI